MRFACVCDPSGDLTGLPGFKAAVWVLQQRAHTALVSTLPCGAAMAGTSEQLADASQKVLKQASVRSPSRQDHGTARGARARATPTNIQTCAQRCALSQQLNAAPPLRTRTPRQITALYEVGLAAPADGKAAAGAAIGKQF